MERRVTRSSRAITSHRDSSVDEPSVPSPKQRRVIETTAADPLRAAIERKIGKSLKVPEKFIQEVEKMLELKLYQTLALMTIVSNHRAGLIPEPEQYHHMMKESKTSLEEFLLFKEDCAAFFTKRFPVSPESSGEGDQPPPPQFNRAEYASHAVEEEERMLVTAQSVKRLSGRDLLPLLQQKSPLKLPPGLAEQLVNKISFSELINEYVSHNS